MLRAFEPPSATASRAAPAHNCAYAANGSCRSERPTTRDAVNVAFSISDTRSSAAARVG